MIVCTAYPKIVRYIIEALLKLKYSFLEHRFSIPFYFVFFQQVSNIQVFLLNTIFVD